MNGLPIIRPTSCPTSNELRDPANAWTIVRATDRWYLGRLVAGSESGLVKLADAFEYRSEYVADPRAKRIGMRVQFFLVEMLPGVDVVAVLPQIMIRLDQCSAKELESMRAALIEPWEGREQLRKVTGAEKISLVEASTP